jgi:Fe-S cluster biogenesis protein NfuA
MLKEKVMDVLNAIKPFLEAYGNGYSEVNIDSDGNVKIKLKNSCLICKHLITQLLREKVPEVREVAVS